MESVYNKLNGYLKGSSRFGINEGIARFLLAYLDAVPHMRLAEVAEQCHVSTPSVIRFCRELGYEDFTDFKQSVIRYQQSPTTDEAALRSEWDINGTAEEYDAFIRAWLTRQNEANIQVLLALDRAQIKRLASDIINYRYVYLFGIGLSGLVADHIRIHLAQFGKTAIALAEPQYGVALTPSPKDTLGIIITQHGRYLRNSSYDLLPYLKKNCAKRWVITQEPPRTSFPADETLYVQSSGHMEEEYHTLFYFEHLLGVACQTLYEQNNKRKP